MTSRELYVTTKDMAEALQLNRDYVTRRVVKRPEFPTPALVLSQKTVLWSRADFDRWVEQQRPKPHQVRG